jgi:hypothetical protein
LSPGAHRATFGYAGYLRPGQVRERYITTDSPTIHSGICGVHRSPAAQRERIASTRVAIRQQDLF